ncbi:hypothetical protein L3X38_016203 [Prunus dulcis]|uniref:non-specific serine/threonine protein kinase n=1 Tax=Prunus dulcis TaxID=3755 RepID=A0AAD4W6G9_PRUDU|nr:hypothetical protein L3X38_016203 [Prunus dulcis]
MSQTFKPFLLPLLGGFALMLLLVHARDDQSGFISIDCGLAGNSSYAEKTTGINYISDETFIDTGERKSILLEYSNRSSFVYGNYDGQNKVPKFDLHLGANLWSMVKLESASTITHKELIHVPRRNYIHVCLVKTGSGVPFISALEIRPLLNGAYKTEGECLALDMRFDTGQNANLTSYRYPYDVFDRFWNGYYDNDWTQLITTSTIDNSNNFRPPEIVLSTAATSKNKNGSLEIRWLPSDNVMEYYVYMHFSEVEKLPGNQSRQMYINRDGKLFEKSLVLRNYLGVITSYNTKALKFLESETNQADVDAIKDMKSTYKIKKNWQGDPCVPQAYLSEGLNCSYRENESPRIISLDLSSSRLTGKIATPISNLKMIHTLDLANNNLIGPIPDFMSQLRNLNVLNLEKNKLTGSVPIRLIDRNKSGLLSLSLCENPNLSGAVSCKRKKNSFVIPLVGSIIGISVLLLCIAAAWWGFKSELLQKQKTPLGHQWSQQNDSLHILRSLRSRTTSSGFLEKFKDFNNFLRRLIFLARLRVRNLHAHLLSGSSSNILTWKDRLQIAIDAAQGLEYLHYGSISTVVAGTLILPSNDDTHISTVVAGTPDYLDPEYNLSNRLNEKSDVYSFGVVLLEIISCRPVYSSREHERIHISRWVSSMLAEGDIYGIVDPRFERHFNTNTVWKAVEIAMACVSPNAIKRPTMSQVEVELKESLATEIAGTRQSHETELTNSIEIRSDSSISMLNPSVR